MTTIARVHQRRQCTISECCREHEAKGFCKYHYGRFKKYQSATAPRLKRLSGEKGFCKIPGCDRDWRALGMCSLHYKRWYYSQPVNASVVSVYKKIRLLLPFVTKGERIEVFEKRRLARKEIRIRARQEVQKALERGEIKRCPCEECGGVAEAHHDDYRDGQLLCVRWLCSIHHSSWHLWNDPIYP